MCSRKWQLLGTLLYDFKCRAYPTDCDTDRVFPFETQIHMVKVPVNCLDNISDFVCEHFEKTTEKEFMEMKMENRAVYNKLMAPDKYIPNFLATVNHS